MERYHKELDPTELLRTKNLAKRFSKDAKLSSNVEDMAYALKLLEKYQEMQDYSGHLKYFVPGTPLSIEHYPRHKIFFDATKDYYECLFMASNRSGKSISGGLAVSAFATGLYHDWWQGRVFRKNIKAWVCADRNNTFKESVQEILLGKPNALGTGMLPPSKGNSPGIIDVNIKPNTQGMFDTIVVKTDMSKQHSIIGSRTYEQGVKAFYGAAVDVIWEDEESDSIIHNECLLRTMTTQGLCMLTFTPLQGLTPLVTEFKKTATLLTEGLE